MSTVSIDTQASQTSCADSAATKCPLKPAADRESSRLDFLDGFRGLAAFYVVFHHISGIYFGEAVNPPPQYYWFTPIMQFGHHAVAVFIALSGFCLMLPVVRSASSTLRGGFLGYMWRRCRRILPPFYAAIALSFLLVLLVPSMRNTSGEYWHHAFGPDGTWQSMFEWQNLLAHLTVFHGLSPDWINRIDPPMWSIAIEWINYILMPILFIPIWRRMGNLALVCLATVFCFLPYLTKPLLHTDRYTFHWLQPWFIALFAIGMAGASLIWPRGGKPTRLDSFIKTVALHWLSPLVLAGALGVFMHKRVPGAFIVGLLTVCLIIHCAARTPLGLRVRAFMESGLMMWLGAISYSLYLFHLPLLQLAARLIEPLQLSAGGRLAFLCFIGTPLTLLFCHVAHRFLEVPFLPQAESRRKDPSPSPAAPMPAPAAQ